jgi:glycosyltransferase involved in cell wall biosynthesis
MKHVLLVGARPPPTGGVATHVRDLGRALSAHSLVEIVDPRRRVRLAARLALAAARGDLVHVHANGHNPRSWLCALACAVGRPSLLTVHSGLAPAFIRAHPRLCGRVARRHAWVVAVNEQIAEALAHAGVPPGRIVVCAAFSAASTDGALRLAPPGLAALRGRHPLLLAAALAPGREYGADVLLDAFAAVHARLPSAGLAVYGPGTRAPSLADQARARGLAGAVHFLGELGREQALALVGAADLFVRPTRADGDALSVREALALGRTVVASDAGPRPPTVRRFAAGSPAALAEQIFHAAGNPAPGVAPERFDCLPTLLAIYRRCAGATFGTPLAVTGS